MPDSATRIEGGVDAGRGDVGVDGGALCRPGECDDGNECTDDVCVPTAGCRNDDNAASCDDGVLCNGGDTCGTGDCSVHNGADPCPGASFCDPASDTCMGCAGSSDCPAPMAGGWSACTFDAASPCGTEGTRSRPITSYACSSGVCEGSTAPETEACTRTTDGIECAPSSVGDWSTCAFSDTCGENGTMTRSVTSSTCVGSSCVPSGTTESMDCTRDTDGTSCGTPVDGPYGPCVASSTCSTSGVETRTVMAPLCSGGACAIITMSQTRGCTTPPTDGMACASLSCGAYGSCMPNTPMPCDVNGTQTRTCTMSFCGGGSCAAASPTTETQGCTVPPGGGCTTRTCTPCLEATMTRCRSTRAGQRMCTTTAGTCASAGVCGGTPVMTTEACTCP